MKELVFATNNSHKLEEVTKILSDSYRIISLNDIGCTDDIAETGDSLEENALIKARHIYNKYGLDCFSDDTGLEVDALKGAPGVYSARYAGDAHDATANMNKLLLNLSGIINRKARFRTVIALIQNGKETLFEGIVAGTIADKPLGEQGFGYDPIFIPNEFNLSFAQLTSNEKNKISHRALALQKLREYLSQSNEFI